MANDRELIFNCHFLGELEDLSIVRVERVHYSSVKDKAVINQEEEEKKTESS